MLILEILIIIFAIGDCGLVGFIDLWPCRLIVVALSTILVIIFAMNKGDCIVVARLWPCRLC